MTSEQEPIYEYVPGQGWVVGMHMHLGKPCPILDLRKDKSSPGVWAYQIWLVDVKGYHYTDWVDSHTNYRWKTIEDAKSWNGSRIKDVFFMELFDRGMTHRLVNLDVSANDYMQGPAGFNYGR